MRHLPRTLTLLAGALVAGGCAHARPEEGDAPTAEIKQILQSGPGSEAALLAGENAYSIGPKALLEERRALLAALDRAEPHYLEPDLLQVSPAPAPADPERAVRRYFGGRVLEVRYPQGVLRISRHRPAEQLEPGYDVAFTSDRRGFGRRGVAFKKFVVLENQDVKRAWERLEAAARREGRVDGPLPGSEPWERSVLDLTAEE